MNIHVTSTPDISDEFIQSICDELNKVKGEMKFIKGNKLSINQLTRVNQSFNQVDEIESLPFDELFAICEGYRFIDGIDDDKFVVLLTSIRNDSNWFSASLGKNIFVDTNDWEELTGKNPKYSISYQIIENIFQSLLGITYQNADGNPNVHFNTRGCINDFCENKSDVLLKLRTADICLSCINRAIELGITGNTLNNIQEIFLNLSKEIRSLNTQALVQPEVIHIYEKGRIEIGNKEIKLEPLPKTLFIFFVKHTDGKALNSLDAHTQELFEIYLKLRPGGELIKIENLVKPYLNPSSTFTKNMSSLNKSLITQLGDSIAEYYTVNKDGDDIYKVRITPDYLDIRPEF